MSSNMKFIRSDIENAVQGERERIASIPLYHSLHEAYSILHEEVEEATDDMTTVEFYLASVWNAVKCDDSETALKHIDRLRKWAVDTASELIQVIAVCDKAKLSLMALESEGKHE